MYEDDIVPKSLGDWPHVAVVVPARNEAETIAQSVDSLAKQDYPGEFYIIVVDDHSEDGTAALARNAAEVSGAAERVSIHSAAVLPQGWTGKLWALNEGVQEAAKHLPEFFWFTDADIEHAPDTLRRLVFRAEKEPLDLASLMVLLQAKTFPERLLIPPFLYFFLMLYPPRWIADPKARTAGAAGGCILLRCEALERIGGLAAIRREVIDDCALARAVKKSGGEIWMGLTRASVSLRGYGSFAEIRNMIARTAFSQLHYSLFFLVVTLAALSPCLSRPCTTVTPLVFPQRATGSAAAASGKGAHKLRKDEAARSTSGFLISRYWPLLEVQTIGCSSALTLHCAIDFSEEGECVQW